MKIDDHEIPKSVVQAWCAALARLPDAKVRSLATEQGLGAGFRTHKMPADVARTRLRSALESYSELPEKVRLALRELSPASALTVRLSDQWVLEQGEGLARCFGQAETIAARRQGLAARTCPAEAGRLGWRRTGRGGAAAGWRVSGERTAAPKPGPAGLAAAVLCRLALRTG
jgi:hypothetical protein